ncbi:DNA primase [Streptomyces sp. 184]|uniref:DNA primase n=1 Tax=Streptomyces sp. 184 TaxID=1827526 RepID=UPI003891D7BF
MTNRLPLALAICAGYVLGRTKKAKFALTVAGMVAGKKLPLNPQALGSLLTEQLNKNPQFKEVRDQLRTELGGVGKAATGALVDRQIGGIADRLEGRTQSLQDRLKGVGRDEADDEAERDDDVRDDDVHDEGAERDEPEPEDRDDAEEEPRKRPARAKKTAAKKTAAKKSSAGKKAAPAKKTASGAKRTASSAKKTAGSRKPSGTGGGGRRG